jgi:hypothetical protein
MQRTRYSLNCNTAAQDSGTLHAEEVPGVEVPAAGPLRRLAATSLAHFLHSRLVCPLSPHSQQRTVVLLSSEVAEGDLWKTFGFAGAVLGTGLGLRSSNLRA